MTFTEAFEAYHQQAFRLAYRILGNREEAEDTVQDVFLTIWRLWEKFDQDRNFKSWMMKILVNRCIDRLRHQKNLFFDSTGSQDAGQLLIAKEVSPDQILENRQLADYVKKLSLLLPPKQKVVFVLRDLENCEMEEISHVTGMPVNIVKQHLYLARKFIRERMWKQ
ncbi:MAG: sigma-70 family RNA polymerase sigma factor [Bacteroidales bacterium]|nr:sigma-70 family RNA polymerase sigma factor [Bacteroidales bacterium]